MRFAYIVVLALAAPSAAAQTAEIGAPASAPSDAIEPAPSAADDADASPPGGGDGLPEAPSADHPPAVTTDAPDSEPDDAPDAQADPPSGGVEPSPEPVEASPPAADGSTTTDPLAEQARPAAERPVLDNPLPAPGAKDATGEASFPLGGVLGAAVGSAAVFAGTAVAWTLAAGLTFILTASFCPAWALFSTIVPLLMVAVGATGPVIAGTAGPIATGAGAYFGASDESLRTRTQLAAGAAPGCALGGVAVCGTVTGGALVALSLILGGPFVGGSAISIYALLIGGLLGASSWAAALFAPPVALAGVTAQAVQLSQFPPAPRPDERDEAAQSF